MCLFLGPLSRENVMIISIKEIQKLILAIHVHVQARNLIMEVVDHNLNQELHLTLENGVGHKSDSFINHRITIQKGLTASVECTDDEWGIESASGYSTVQKTALMELKSHRIQLLVQNHYWKYYLNFLLETTILQIIGILKKIVI